MASKRMAKTELVAAVAENRVLTKRQADAALTAIHAVVARKLGNKGPGEAVLPGLLKLSVVTKPATAQHEGTNPFTKEPMTYKAKTARKLVKIRALKALTDAV